MNESLDVADDLSAIHTEVIQQVSLYPFLNLSRCFPDSQRRQVCHLQITESTGINTGKGFQVDVDIQCHAMIAGAAAYS